ncbi:creatininase family protein [Burkholderia sp. MR1-5-21]
MSDIARADFRRYQLELLLPSEIRASLARSSVVYLPLGTIEWHCEHLPVGLDALTAHGVCLRAAARTGGVVYPPLHYGTGGDHGRYPWTVMMEEDAEIATQLRHTLTRLQDFGVETAVLFTGHFADSQIDMVENLTTVWNSAGNRMKAIAAAVNMAENVDIPPDHAGVFETTLLYALCPDRVDVSRLPVKDERIERPGDGWGPERHEHGNPLWGVVGPDPRDFDPEAAGPLLEAVVGWLTKRVSDARSGHEPGSLLE